MYIYVIIYMYVYMLIINNISVLHVKNDTCWYVFMYTYLLKAITQITLTFTVTTNNSGKIK